MARAPSSPHVLAVARGDEPADLLLRRGRVLSPSTREWVTTDLAVCDGVVAGWGPREAIDVIESGKPKTLEFGVADETAWKVGLSCGGTIRVFVEKVE